MDEMDPVIELREVEGLISGGETPSPSFSKVVTLVKRRGIKRGITTKLINKIKTEMSTSLNYDVKSSIDNLKLKLDDLIAIDNDILDQFSECSEFDFQASDKLCMRNDFYTSNILALMNQLKSRLTEGRVSHNQPPTPNQEGSRSSLQRVTAPLPTFGSNEDEDLASFFAQLESTLSIHAYSEYDKLVILRKQVSGRALKLINSLEPDDESYDRAKSLLMNALASPEIQKTKLIKKLCELRPTSDFDPYSYVGDMKTILYRAKKLELCMDDIFQFFFWRGLNDKFQDTFVGIVNKSRPTLQDMSDANMFLAADRYLLNCGENKSKTKHERVVSSLATNIDVSQKQSINNESQKKVTGCSICRTLEKADWLEHKLFNCNNFKSPEAKLQKIKELGGCEKCGYMNHKVENCKFKFKNKCTNCDKWHSSFLCSKKQNNASTKNTGNKNTSNIKNKKNTQTNLVELQVTSVENPSSEQLVNSLHLNSHNVTSTQNITLPTFTTTCKNKNNNNQDLRVLYDSGSEMSFISQSMAQKLKYKVIQSGVLLNIKGFNCNRYYQTHIIEVDLKIKNKMCSVLAAVVPNIQTKVNTPPLQVLEAFHKNKIPLADRHLKNKNNREIHLLLGVNGAHILPINACSFGMNNDISLLYYTSVGMLLAGDLNTLIKNVPHLHCVKIFMEQANLLHENTKINNKRE